MKNRIPFFLGLILGPVGAVISRILYGRETNGDSLRGMGAFICLICFFRVLTSEMSRSRDIAKTAEQGQYDETQPPSVPETRCESMSCEDAKTSAQVDAVDESTALDVTNTQMVQPEEQFLDARHEETREKMLRIKDQVLKFRAKNHGRLPSELSQLYEICEKFTCIPCRDAWGRRFSSRSLADDFVIVSAGPDRLFDTEDDLKTIIRNGD